MAPLLALLFMSAILEAAGAGNDSSSQSVFSLDRYGARGDRRHDDTHALEMSWKAAWASPRPAVVLVPNGRRYLLKLVTLRGPCKSSVTLTVKGTLVASPDRGGLERQGQKALDRVPKALQGSSNGFVIPLLHQSESGQSENCEQPADAHVSRGLHGCAIGTVIHDSACHEPLILTASTSLGAMMYGSQTARSRPILFFLLNFTGDDCMSIENGTHNLHVSKVVCGPGHGISIGSLGDDYSRAEVSGITIDSVQLHGATNGARIKTYQGGSGYAKDITFQNMAMYGVKNPIIIDQHYCDKAKPCVEQRSAVQVSNVVFKNIRGTTITKHAIKMNCSKNVSHAMALP
ncbi:unnamed protein product [Miscanthus lutarioriparius]|uniref:Polygalacturonase n=1 Tax=Miscanthus lutarioriparius TaxID=422564 RepID=A0A811MP62_9POAL|nr:unnamed protein product [Miscanthus lutarioriparius]